MAYQPKYLVFLRVFLFAAGLLYSVWSLLIIAFAPASLFDKPYERCLVTLVLWAVAAASFRVEYIKRHFYVLTQILIWGYSLHFFTLIVRSEGDTLYWVSTNVIIPILSFGIFALPELFAFAAIFLLGDIYLVFSLKLEPWPAAYLVATNLTIFIQVATSLRQRLSADLRAKQEEDRALALKSELMHNEMETAAAVQTTLLSLPSNDSKYLNVNTFFKPASCVGGDSYSYHVCNDGKSVVLWIGDVTGHGIGSAILTATMFGAIAAEMNNRKFSADSMERDLTQLVERLNLLMLRFGQGALMTLLVIGVDLETGLACSVNAGHNFARHFNKGTVETIRSRGNPLGIELSDALELIRFKISRGDMLLMHTDGLLECENQQGGHLSRTDLDDCLKTAMSGGNIIERIKDRLQALGISTQLSDDISIMVASFDGV